MCYPGRLLLLSITLISCVAAHAAGIAVSGRVVGPGGTPVAEADVELTPVLGEKGDRWVMLDPAHAEPVARGRTNASGRYRVEAPRVGLWRVRVTAEGFVPVVTELRPLIEEVELQDAELSADSGMNVRVTDGSGQPLAGATVLAWFDRGGRFFFGGSRWKMPPRFGTADTKGKILLAKSDLEEISLSAWAPGHALTERRGVRGTAATLALTVGQSVELEVVSGADIAVPGVMVALGRGGHPIGFTNDSGRFSVPLEPESPNKLALAAGDGRGLETSIGMPRPEDRAEGEEPSEESDLPVQQFRLPDQTEIAGKLIDRDTRRPVVDGLVWDAELPDLAAAAEGGGRFTLTVPSGAERRLTAGAPGYLEADGVSFQPGAGRPGPTLSLRPAAAVEGMVVDGNGDPVVGAEVELAVKSSGGFGARRMMRFFSGESLRGVSREDGTFRLSPVDPEGSWLVRAVADGFAPSEAPVNDLEPGRTVTDIEITLASGLTITGTVVDGSGVPLASVSVELKPAQEGGRLRFTALTGDAPTYEASSDTEGRFAVRGLPAGKFDLATERAGFAPRRMSAIEIDEELGTLDLGEIKLAPGETLTGYVTDPDGLPVEGVEVRGGGDSMFFPALVAGPATEPDAVTDPSGWFQLVDLAAGEENTLTFQRTGYVPESLRAVEAPRAEPLQVEIEPASEVRGTIVGDGGRPVADASVRLVRMRDFGFGRRGPREMPLGMSRTDDDGGFVIEGISPGKASLVADAPGHREGRLDDLEVLVGEDLEGLRLSLERGAVVQGQVKAPDGRPVIGARVGEVRDQEARVSFGRASATTDGDGQYHLDGLAPGQLSIEAGHDDYPRLVRDVEVRAGANRLDMQFEGGADVRGLVLDASGNPVADALVGLNPGGRGWGGPSGRSESDGSFTIAGVKDGDYELTAVAEGYARTTGLSVVVAGESVDGLEVRLDQGATLEGAIRGLDAENLGRVTVRANAGSFRNSRSGVANHQGTYRIENLLPGDYQIVATESASGRRARGSVTVEPDAPLVTLDLEFEEGLALSGRAIQGEEPIVGAWVSARGVDVSAGSSTRTDPDGGFELEGLQAGRYRVSLSDWQTGLSHEEDVDLGASREIVLRVPAAVIGGEVTDGSDTGPLAGVAVFAERDAASGGRPVSKSATTGSDGRFEIGNLADGEWRLTANKKGYAAHTRTVIVSAGQGVDDVEIALSPTEGLTLEVRLPSGAAPDQVYAAVLDGGGTALVAGSYATGEGGRVRLSSVPPGTWELLVGSSGSATSSFGVSAPGPPVAIALEPPSRLHVRLPGLIDTGSVATVRARDASGRPFRMIGWSGQTRSEWRVTTGHLELSSLPPGTWIVTATTPDGRSWEGRATTTAGATVELVLD